MKNDYIADLTRRRKQTEAIKGLYELLFDLGIGSPKHDRYLAVAHRMEECGTYLAIKRNTETDKRRLHRANFCKSRFCPFCSWRKSEKNFVLLNAVLTKAQERDKRLRFIFLTLTIPNVETTSGELSKGIKRLLKAYGNLIHHFFERYCKAYRGSFRNLEITINEKDGTLHPHLHALLAVDQSYFNKDSDDFILNDDLEKVWAKMVGEEQAFTKLKGLKGDMKKSVLELSKYIVKDEQILSDSPDDSASLLQVLDDAMLGVRTTSYSGVLKKIYSELKDTELEADQEMFPPLKTVIEVYRWNGFSDYSLTNSDPFDEYAEPSARIISTP